MKLHPDIVLISGTNTPTHKGNYIITHLFLLSSYKYFPTPLSDIFAIVTLGQPFISLFFFSACLHAKPKQDSCFFHLHLLPFTCSRVTEVTGPGQNPRPAFPQWHAPAPPGIPEGVPRLEKINNPSREFWVCSGASYQMVMAKKTLGMCPKGIPIIFTNLFSRNYSLSLITCLKRSLYFR